MDLRDRWEMHMSAASLSLLSSAQRSPSSSSASSSSSSSSSKASSVDSARRDFSVALFCLIHSACCFFLFATRASLRSAARVVGSSLSGASSGGSGGGASGGLHSGGRGSGGRHAGVACFPVSAVLASRSSGSGTSRNAFLLARARFKCALVAADTIAAPKLPAHGQGSKCANIDLIPCNKFTQCFREPLTPLAQSSARRAKEVERGLSGKSRGNVQPCALAYPGVPLSPGSRKACGWALGDLLPLNLCVSSASFGYLPKWTAPNPGGEGRE